MISPSVTPLPSSHSTASHGSLRIHTISKQTGRPIENATIIITEPDRPDLILAEATTDCNGRIEPVELSAPPCEYSMEPCTERPYSEYNLRIRADGYRSVTINRTQILAKETAIHELSLTPVSKRDSDEYYNIPKHVLCGEYPPKIAEDEVKHFPAFEEAGQPNVVIPDTIVVHNGPPTDSSARNYQIKYRDYIKSAASCGIYATWSNAALEANILAIMSFTLNRIYTEWYRNKGYLFTITGSGAYDQKWTPHMTVYERISLLVDSIFSNYLSRPAVVQPIFTQCSDGHLIKSPNWLSKWGSKSLGDAGYPAIHILRKYYGDSIYINTAGAVSGSPSSWPGTTLNEGSGGDKVRRSQLWLNAISTIYTQIPKSSPDGNYGKKTKDAVIHFQKIFCLPQTGAVDFRTWYQISAVYLSLNRMSELY